MSTRLIDFHGHWFPPAVVGAEPPAGLPALLREAWPLLTDAAAQAEAVEAAGIDLRVLSAPLSSLRSPGAGGGLELSRRTNDALAEVVAEHRVLDALATVDAYAGEAGAEEARRAVEELGLRGLVVDAADGEQLLADPVARPTLAYAAEAGVPVFAHPVGPDGVAPRYRGAGGVLVLRGAESTIATLALLAGGVLEELPGLELVLAGIGAPALLYAGMLPGGDAAGAGRERITIDTMGFDPVALRGLLAIVGSERLIVGSDWPIMPRNAGRERVDATLDALGLAGDARAAVAGGNAARLLGLPAAAPVA